MNTCSNHIGYAGEKWGVTICEASPTLQCQRCHLPACSKHIDTSERYCQDCWQEDPIGSDPVFKPHPGFQHRTKSENKRRPGQKWPAKARNQAVGSQRTPAKGKALKSK